MSESESELDDILNEEPETVDEKVETETKTTETATATEETKGDEKATEEESKKDDSKEAGKDKEDPTPGSEDDSKKDWSYHAYQDEKHKRQELEGKLKAYEATVEQEPAPDVFEDQDAFTQHVATQANDVVGNAITNMSQFHAEREFGKETVDAKLESFKQLLADNPEFGKRVHNSPSPYYEMIDIVDKAEKLKEFDNVDVMKEKMRSEIEKEVRAELAGETGKKDEKQATTDTPSLNNQRSSDGGTNTNATEDQTLEEILGR